MHPNIVKLFDIFISSKDSKKELSLTFEFFKDGDLHNFVRKQYLNGKGMPVAMVIDFTEQLLEAVKFIHDNGFLHRDLKPSNILVGEPKTRVGRGFA